MLLQSGQRIREYEIIRLLGEGGMGEVWLAKEILLDRLVAIKLLNPALTREAQFVERFTNEARIQAQLVHANIVQLITFFNEDNTHFMVMEYASGITLKELIQNTGPIPESRALRIFHQIVAALGYAHIRNIIHRDIKPSNIMIDPANGDQVKIMDFGIARLMTDMHLTRTGTKMGTLYYMSPEQVIAQKDIDHRSDIYSMGVVLYEMLSGRIPFDVNTESDFLIQKAIVDSPLPDPRQHYGAISQKTVDLIALFTQKERDERPENILDIFTKETDILVHDKILPASERPEQKKRPLAGSTDMGLIHVPGGSFDMGSDVDDDEEPIHEVTVSSFWIGKYPVTQKEWNEVMGSNPSNWKGNDRNGLNITVVSQWMGSNPSNWKGNDLPVERVTWYEAILYCNKRSIKEGLSPCYSGSGDNMSCNWNADGYRLPTEAEWEYAAKGGQKSKGYKYSGSNDIGSVAWYEGNSGRKTHAVGTKAPNELGICDMSGNVWELCWDWYDKSYYAISPTNDPKGPSSGQYRLLRGGSWDNYTGGCRVADRSFNKPDCRIIIVGFRVCRTIR